MKNLKVNFTIVALMVAVVLSAFTTNHKNIAKSATFDDVWYEYQGAQTATERAKPINYVKFTSQPTNIKVTCPDAVELCAVKLPDNGLHPASVPAQDIENAVAGSDEIDNFIELKED